jgi:hypothetical protein
MESKKQQLIDLIKEFASRNYTPTEAVFAVGQDGSDALEAHRQIFNGEEGGRWYLEYLKCQVSKGNFIHELALLLGVPPQEFLSPEVQERFPRCGTSGTASSDNPGKTPDTESTQ